MPLLPFRLVALAVICILTTPASWAGNPEAPKLQKVDAELEKSGTYRLGQSIPLFQTALTSTHMFIPKNPRSDFGVNCMSNHREGFIDKKLGVLEKLSGERTFRSEYIFRAKWFHPETAAKSIPTTTLCKYTDLYAKPTKFSEKGSSSSKQRLSSSLRRLLRLIKDGYRMNLMLPGGLRVQQVNMYDATHNERNLKALMPRAGMALAMPMKGRNELYVITKWKFILVRTAVKADKTFNVIHFYAVPQKYHTIKELSAAGGTDIEYDVEVVEQSDNVKLGDRGTVNAEAEREGEPDVVKFDWLIGVCAVLVSSVLCGTILARTIFNDIAVVNKDIGEFLMSDEDKMLESGWKLVHADVFRSPGNAMLLCVTIGYGLEILLTIVLTAMFGAIHTLDLAVWMFMMYNISGIFGGFLSARFYKSFGGERWKLCVFLTHFFYPMIFLTILAIANTVLWATDDTKDGSGNLGAIPAGTLFAALGLWICVGFPLTFLGAYFGFKRDAFEYPVRTNLIPRQIPTQSATNKLLFRAVSAGLLVFLSFGIQMFFINTSFLGHQRMSSQFYGLLIVASILSAIVCAEMGVVSTYRQLTGENYNWWWQSMICTGMSGLFLFVVILLSAFGNFIKFENGSYTDSTVNGVVFVCVTLVLSCGIALMNAFIGFMASWFFVRKLYRSVRID